MIEEIIRYRCTRCGKEFDDEVIKCPCESRLEEGKVVGPFTLIEKERGGWKVKCNLCTQYATIHSSNLNRQKSCGCVPRHIRVVDITGDKVRLNCIKCNSTVIESLPVLEYCCDDS